MRKTLVFATIFALAATQLSAQSELKTKSVSVFKNGKSFVVKEGTVSTSGNNEYTLSKMPNALFGSLWFSGGKSGIVQVSGKIEKVNEPVERKANTFIELLHANKGKQITLVTTSDKTYTGVIEDFELPEEVNSLLKLKEEEISAKYDLSSLPSNLFPPIYTSILTLKVDNKWVSIQPTEIRTIEFAEKPERITKSNVQVKKPVIKVQFTSGGNQTLNLMYLQNGLQWTPVYQLELLSDTEGRLKLQAEVINGVEDIENTDVNFVVGVPNFKYADSPATLSGFNNQPVIRASYNNFSNAFASQKLDAYESEVVFMDEFAEGGEMPNISAEAAEDFYFYTVKNLSLVKGGRAHYPLFNTPVKIKHLYQCALPLSVQENSYNYSSDGRIGEYKKCNVVHSIEIKNDTKDPFTTGSVFLIDAKTQKPLTEDMLKYTGAGRTSTIQLTQSPDVRVDEKESIVSNDSEKIIKRNGYNYRLYNVQGEVTVTNSKKQAIDLEITKTLLGKSKTASIKYDSRQVINNNNVNPYDYLTFNLNLKAGQSEKFTYTYEIYVRQ